MGKHILVKRKGFYKNNWRNCLSGKRVQKVYIKNNCLRFRRKRGVNDSESRFIFKDIMREVIG